MEGDFFVPQKNNGLDTAAETEEDPRALLRRFLWIGLLCLVTLLFLATYGLYRVLSLRLVESAHREAQAICHILLVKEKMQLLAVDANGRTRLRLPPSELARFNKRLRISLKPYNIDTVRIWGRDKHPVNLDGTNRDLPTDKISPALDQALKGEGLSRLEKNADPMLRDEGRPVRHEQVVSYLPIPGRNKTILGALELRRGVEHLRAEVRRAVVFSALWLGMVLSVLFGCVYLLVKRGSERLARAQKALRYLATTDPLTGVCNRREVMARAETLLSQRQKDPAHGRDETLSILMIDYDDFKVINDTYGHPVGDGVLRELASRILGCLRPGDFLGRMGGEEFLVVLPGCGVLRCRDIAERLCQIVKQTPFNRENLRIYGSVSIGMVTAQASDEGIETLLHRADAGLYQAKNTGKNRVSQAGEAPFDPDPSVIWAGR